MIELREIEKRYPTGDTETVVLRDVSFRIDAGEFVAIMGPSGSGKSTLMHILGLLDAPSHGTYLLEGTDVAALPEDERAAIRSRRIGFVFQAFNLLPRATVFRNVALPLVYAGMARRVRRAHIERALTAAGLPADRWQHRSNQLSGGQMQRVAIARALVNDPALLLADEPTGNLDTATGEVVLETFQRLHQEAHRTIVLITHEQYVAEHAQRILHIRDGAIREDIRNHAPRIARITSPHAHP
ncbi:ABC transporter ATP-binding protein [Candidatus Uhrbacteria bacterium]|nr:ABC transporter ATP-binding protein [Candidatus Uhrbacteria bacterium]